MNSTATDRKIKIIPPKANMNTEKKKKVKKINVAAYCRVSTAQEDQETSYEAQVAYFTKLITENPSWNLAGIYADDGISGTDMKKRDNFNAMMERCLQKDGDIDLILTKSISRFARNTVDCLSCIRKLKERNIAIYFEKEHINTLESTGELLITILSSQAQEESRNISENVKWGLKRKYEKGEMLVRRMFGYGKGTDGQLYIIPEEAEVVRLIYGKYLEGESLNSIARLLKEKGIKTIRGNIEWKDDAKLNLLWSSFRSPVYQNIAGNALQTTETAHPFRIEEDSIMCAFIEFADVFDSFGKTFMQETKPLFENIVRIRKDYADYAEALSEYQSLEEYKKAKSIIEKEFFWNIGQYRIEIETFYKNESVKYSFTFSISESDYRQLKSNIDESLVSPLKDRYAIMRNYQWADIELKEA